MAAIWDSSSSNNSRNQFIPVNKRCIKQFIKVLAGSWTNRDRQTQIKIGTGTLLKNFQDKVVRRSLFAYPKFFDGIFFFNKEKAIQNEIPEIKGATSNVNFVKYFSTVKNSSISITVRQSI